MNTLANRFQSLAKRVDFSGDRMIVELLDGRQVSVPLNWFPRLLRASARERGKWELVGGGIGIHWPLLDEDISVENLVATPPSTRQRPHRTMRKRVRGAHSRSRG